MSAMLAQYETGLDPSPPHRPPPLDQLLPALFRAYAAIEAPLKRAVNPHFKSKFADLGSVMDAVREPLASNGLMLLHLLEPVEGGGQVLVTRLLHSSGQYIESRARLLLAKQDAQGMGSAITYMRRYTIQCMLGIVPEDDDGNAASHTSAPAAKSKQVGGPIMVGTTDPIKRLQAQLDGAADEAAVDAIVSRLPPLTYTQREQFNRLAKLRRNELATFKKETAK